MKSQRKWLVGIAAALICLAAGQLGANTVRSDNVNPTNSWVDFYSAASTYLGAPVPEGAEIAVFDPQGVRCGEFTVVNAGAFGVMPCYGDDPTTLMDEGAVVGDSLRFTINGKVARTEAIALS